MITLISLVIEGVTIVVCFHRLYGQKIRLDLKTVCLVIIHVLFLGMFNFWQISKVAVGIIYIIYFVYCKAKFKESFIMSGISIFLLGVIMTSFQFMCLIITSIFIPENEPVRIIISDIEALCCILLLPGSRLDRLRKYIFIKNKGVAGILGFVGMVIVFLLMQDKMSEGVQAEMFVFAVPAVLMIVVLVGKWNSSQERIEQIEKELDNNIRLQEKYSELLQKVRLRQHEFKNQLAEIFSSHYTYKTYDKLVEAQREYCQKLAWENRHNGLSLIGNDVLAGFLYGKFQELEEGGLCVECEIHTKLQRMAVPNYYVIEALGILIDNAAEAYKDAGQGKVSFSVAADEDSYCFKIRNQFAYVPYAQIEQWFKLGGSTKGEGRGLGLHHVKTLCNEWEMSIRCENIEIGRENWIMFTLVVKSAGSQE